METLSEYMLRRFCSAYPTVPITLSKVKAYLDTVDDWRELDDSHLALIVRDCLRTRDTYSFKAKVKNSEV